MADFSQKESIFPGYDNPESPDIDFHDVFGGSLRRASIQELRSRFKDSFELRREDETISNRLHRWSGLSEKPVFGEEIVSRRRQNASDDFFDDIFGGNGSLSASPRDPFNSVHHKKKDSILKGPFSDSPLSGFSIKAQELRNSGSSPISHESVSLEESEDLQKDGNMKDSTDFQVPSASHQFHFSVHRWASKGVPLPSSFRRGCSSKTKEQFNFERSWSASGRIACEGMAKDSSAETSNKIDSDFSIFVATDEVKKSEEKSTEKSSAAKNAGEEVSKRDDKGMAPNKVEIDEASAEETPIRSPHIPAKNRAKGKIKELLKIYDQKTSDQSTLQDSLLSRSFRWMERGKFRTRDEQNLWTRNTYKDRPSTSTEKVDTLPKEPKKRGSRVRINDCKEMKICSSAASIPDGSEVRDENVADSCPEYFQVEELTQEQAKVHHADNNQEEIRATDDKIRTWSQGKQGNIRALLSTLQYVLWCESGWKPVPLVDIVEGNALKRSYQRALLCLHPDKLQQKGATSNQKYIAEKVFDVLQEAWTQFNSLGSL